MALLFKIFGYLYTFPGSVGGSTLESDVLPSLGVTILEREESESFVNDSVPDELLITDLNLSSVSLESEEL